MDTIGSRLRHVRTKAGFSSARSAALRFGWPPSTYAAHENGQNDFDTEIAVKYSRAFKADPIWLMMGNTWYETGEFVPIVGTVNNRGDISVKCGLNEIMIDVDTVNKQAIIAIARASFCSTSGMVAFQVEGDSQEPAYIDGDLLLAFPLINSHSKGARAVCEFENGTAKLCRTVDLKNPLPNNRILSGRVEDIFGSELGASTIKQGWSISIVLPSNNWSLYRDTDPTWANALSAVQQR